MQNTPSSDGISANASPSTHETWTPSSWKSREARQQPLFENDAELARVVEQLAVMPPLVTPWEVNRLRGHLAEASQGKRFLLQGGDCAERFDECRSDIIANRLKVLLQMSLVLIYGLRLPVIRVGRFAGQYAKPRSADFEGEEEERLPSYRGDMINAPEFSRAARQPSPTRMLTAYERSALTLNYVRALGEGGFADLHHPEQWDLDFVTSEQLRDEYQSIVNAILDALRFTEAVSPTPISNTDRVSFFSSHEALILPYEEAFTRMSRDGAYNLSTHFPWIGKRTGMLESAHIEYVRGLRNPIGLKVGADSDARDLRAILDRVDPAREPGRVTLITRMGAHAIEDTLPRLIESISSSGHPVLWTCDPMHGNTEVTDDGLKTRRFENIQSELEQAFDIHHACGSILGGVHLELTGENVTECTGGARGLEAKDLHTAYQSEVDPRLNAEQALEMAFSIVQKCRTMRSTIA
ncbi:MAG: 3-deoxy-7-phosphoheptulonate synthase class II [Rhodothermales bacterium]